MGLDMPKFQSCVDGGKYVAAIRADIAEASSVGILGTPSFVLGKTAAAGFEGVKLVGAQPYEVFEKAILEQLAKTAAPHTD
jgi:predicted DsbA family dithiol-disulfide isomerase